MSRRARTRRDRRVILNPIEVAIANAQKLPMVSRLGLQRIVIDAFAEFRRGVNCADHWMTMADALNMAESLSKLGIASDEASVERINAGQHALAAVTLRSHESGSWTLYASEMTAIGDALFTHRIQLNHVSLREYENAERMTRNRVFQARHGNAPAGAIVIEGGIGRSAQVPA